MRSIRQDQHPGDHELGADTAPGSRRWIALGAVTLAAVTVGGVAATSLGGSGEAEAEGAATQSTATTKIVKQDLVEQETVDGTLGYSDARPVTNRLGGTVTWTPRVGSVVETNHRLYEVDGKAVYLLDGAYPAYRTLQPGTEGDDVLALERNLRALGLDSSKDMRVDGTWDSGTTAAVKRWQDRKGMSKTGSIEKGRIVFQPGARRVGEIAIKTGESASGGGGAGNAPASTQNAATVFQNASVAGGAATLQTVALAEPAASGSTETRAAVDDGSAITAVRAQAPDGTSPTTPTPTPTPAQPKAPKPSPTPKPQTPQGSSGGGGGTRARPSAGGSAPSGGAGGSGGAASGAGGSGASGGSSASGSSTTDVSSTVMTTTSVKRIVAVDLEATKQALAKVGGEVSVELPDGEDVAGTIVTVSKVAQKKASSADDDPPATIKVVIKLKESAGTGLDQAPVDVSLEKTRSKSVLTVPVTALIARQGGSFAVEVRDGASRKIVEVEPGLYTDSYVEIEGRGLAAGMTVTDARV